MQLRIFDLNAEKRSPSQRIFSFVNKGVLLKVEFISCLHGCIRNYQL